MSGSTPVTSARRVIAAGIAGYAALSIAALSAAIMFGIQPFLHKTANGESLYCPYGLNIAIPAMLGGHVLVFGWVEAVVTAGVVKYLQKQSPDLLEGKAAKI